MRWDRRPKLTRGGYWTCRVKHRERGRKWRAENPEKQQACEQNWRDGNKDKTAERVRKWQEGNPEKHRAKARAYYARHRERLVEAERLKRATDPEDGRARNRRYRETHKAERIAYTQLRRAQKVSTDCDGYATVERLRARVDFYGGRCAYCGGSHEALDHRIPLSRGGLHLPANILPACRWCNSSKGAKTESEFRQRQIPVAIA